MLFRVDVSKFWCFLELNTLLAQAGEIPLAEPEVTLMVFKGSELFIAAGKDGEVWVNHVHLCDDPA